MAFSSIKRANIKIGQEGGLPKTGQTSPSTTGDDGTYQAGCSTSPRYVDTGKGTIIDKVTNLVWVKQPELIIPGASIPSVPSNQVQANKSSWTESTAYTAGDMVQDGGANYYVCAVSHTSTAQSLFPDYQEAYAYVVGDKVYDAAGSYYYATCTKDHTSTGTNISVDSIANGYDCWNWYTGMVIGLFTYDRQTYPTYWRETGFGQFAYSTIYPLADTWSTWISKIEALDYAGNSDWRMPNINELLSIVNYANYNPSIDGTFFPGTLYGTSDYYLSSTTYAQSSSQCKAMLYTEPVITNIGKSASYFVRPVRGGSHL